MTATLRTGLPISLAVHSLIIAGLVFLFPAAPQDSPDEEAVAVEILDEIVMEKQEAVAEDNVTEPVVASVEVESTALEVKTAALAEAAVAMDMSSKVEIAINQPETESVTTEASLSLDMTPDIAIEADAPKPQTKPVEASLALDMTPNIAMEQVASDIAPSPVAEAGVMMTIKSEFEIAAIDQSAQAAPSAEASVSMSIAPPPVAKQPPPEKKKAEKKTKKPAHKKVTEENFAAKTGKPRKSSKDERAAKIAAERKKSNTKKSAGKNVTTALQKQKRTGLGGQGEAATKTSKGATARYNSIVRARLAASFRRGEGRGRVMISFTLHPDGRMSGGRVSRSSGSGSVDAAALSALRRTSFPAFLPGMPRKPKAFSIPMAIQ